MKEKIKTIKTLVIGILIGALLVPTAFATVATVTKEIFYNDIKITLDGNALTPTDASGNYVEPFIMDGTTYLPVRGVANALGLGIEWDGTTNTVKLSSDKADTPSADGKITKVGDVIFNEDGIKVTLTEIKEEEDMNEYIFLMENNASDVAFLMGEDVSANDFMAYSEIVLRAQPGKKDTSSLVLLKGRLSDHKKDKISKIEFTARYHVGSGTDKEKLITLYFE